jgi:hypothetical protein
MSGEAVRLGLSARTGVQCPARGKEQGKDRVTVKMAVVWQKSEI